MYIDKLVRGVKTTLKPDADYLINTFKNGSDYWSYFSLDKDKLSICVSKDANIYEIAVYDSYGENIDVKNSCVVYTGQWLTDFLA